MAKERAEELVKALHKYMEAEGIHITASIGVALARGRKTDFEVLYKTADYALYQAKKQGRDRYVIKVYIKLNKILKERKGTSTSMGMQDKKVY